MDGLKTFKPNPPLQELPPNICQKIFQTKMMRPNSTARVFVIPFRDHLPLKSRTIGLQRIQSQCHPRPMHKFVRSSALAQPTLRSACDSIEGLAAADWKNFLHMCPAILLRPRMLNLGSKGPPWSSPSNHQPKEPRSDWFALQVRTTCASLLQCTDCSHLRSR